MTAEQSQFDFAGTLPVEERSHDPGGKRRIKLKSEVLGQAEFHGPDGCYRSWLYRQWDGNQHPAFPPLPYAQYIAMNPSTADENADDHTVRKMTEFARLWGYKAMFVTNLFDYRCTNPVDLLRATVPVISDSNFATIIRIAKAADRVVYCHGHLHKSLAHYSDTLAQRLRDAGIKLWCFGRNYMDSGPSGKDGSPKHPLMLGYDRALEQF